MRGNGWWIRGEDGVTAIEYGLIAAGVGLTAIAALTLLGDNLQTVYVNAVDAPGLTVCAPGEACAADLPVPTFSADPLNFGQAAPASTAPAPSWPTAAACSSITVSHVKAVKGTTFTKDALTYVRDAGFVSPRLESATATGSTSGEDTGTTPWSWSEGGTITWVAPNSASAKIVFSLKYAATSCAGTGPLVVEVQANG